MTRHAACDGQGRRSRVPAVLIQALGDLAAPNFATAGSPNGRAWIAALPTLSGHLARQWELTVTSEWLRHGYNAVVLPVAQGGRPPALKLAWPPGQARGEAEALAAWRGRESSSWWPLTCRVVPCFWSAWMPPGHWLASRWPRPRYRGHPDPHASHPALAALSRTAGRRPPARRHIRRPPVLAPGPHSPSVGHTGRPARRRPGRRSGKPPGPHTDLHYDKILASARPGQPWVAWTWSPPGSATNNADAARTACLRAGSGSPCRGSVSRLRGREGLSSSLRRRRAMWKRR